MAIAQISILICSFQWCLSGGSLPPILRKVTRCRDRCLEYRNLRNHLTNFSQHFVQW
jgi:hypothetical protein